MHRPPRTKRARRVKHIIDWVDIILIGWVCVSALLTPLVGRFLGNMFPDPDDDVVASDEAVTVEVRHDMADV